MSTGPFAKFMDVVDCFQRALHVLQSSATGDQRLVVNGGIDFPMTDAMMMESNMNKIGFAIENGQRFLFPACLDIVNDESLFTGTIARLVRLPFQRIAVLSEVAQDKRQSQWYMIACEEADAETGDLPNDPAMSDVIYCFRMFVAMMSPVSGNRWMLLNSKALVLVCEHGAPRIMLGFPAPTEGTALDDKTIDRVKLFFDYAARIIINMTVLLGTVGARADVVTPPPSIQAARKRRGKLAFMDYHILNIGGDVFDSPHVTTGAGAKKRSHLRRGHIRHLTRGDRYVWVRDTFVHGKRDGFVAKDYAIKGKK